MAQTIFTFGYVGLKPAAIRDKVEEADATVVDIRFMAYSRAPQWTRRGFQDLLGSRYVYVKALGNRNYKNPGNILIDDIEKGFLTLNLTFFQPGQSVALMCGCPDFNHCHRTPVAEFLSAHTNIPVVHWGRGDIMHPGVEKELRETRSLIKRDEFGLPQLNLFGGEDLLRRNSDNDD